MFRLSYTAKLYQTDANGNPAGDVFTVSGSQVIASNAPQSSDIVTAATAAGVDIGAQMAASYPVQVIEDSAAVGG